MVDEEPRSKRRRYNLRSNARRRQQMFGSTSQRAKNSIAMNEIQVQVDPKRKQPKRPNLMMLNADCMLKIFEFVSPIDLCSIAEVNDWLHHLANYFFRLKFKRFDFNSYIQNGPISIDAAKKLFKMFGNEMCSLNMSREQFRKDEFNSVALLMLANDYCKSTVKELTLSGFNIFQCALETPLFASIERITLIDCFMCSNYLCSLNNLKVLKIHSVDGSWDFYENTSFPCLEEVAFEKVNIFDEELSDFLLANSTIKRLSIAGCSNISSSIFNTIERCTQLEELEFQMNYRFDVQFQQNSMKLTSLKHLNVLKLDCTRMSVAELFKTFALQAVPIEHLELFNGLFDFGTAMAVAELTSIRILKFNQMIAFSGIFVQFIVDKLKDIKELHIETEATISEFRIKKIVDEAIHMKCLKIDATNCTIGEDSYQTILATVQRRNNLNPLAITIYGDEEQLSIPRVLMQGRNQKWLKIEKLNRNCNRLFPINQLQSSYFDFHVFIDDEFEDDEWDGFW